jgi:hemolysin III
MSTVYNILVEPRAFPALDQPRRAPAAVRPPIPAQDRAEELANGLTHGSGLLLSLGALYALVRVAAVSSDPVHAFGCVVYGASLVALYSASTCYHLARPEPVKRVLLLADHVGIYVLIAGTYTPVALVALGGRFGHAMLALAWGAALAGSLVKAGHIDRLDRDSPWPYVALAFLALASLGRLWDKVPTAEVHWLVAGGLFYATGLVFFVRENHRFNHAIWHLFVLAGSICHYLAVVEFAAF